MALEVERSEREAFADMIAAAEGTEAARFVQGWRHGPDGFAVGTPSLPMTLFNRVFGLGLEAGPGDTLLDELAARLGPERSPRFGIQPAPGPLGDAWRERLRARGFEPRLQSLVQMARDLHAMPQEAVAPAPELEVGAIAAAEAEAFARTVVAGFGMPAWFEPGIGRLPGREHWHCFVAARDGIPVAAAALFVRDAVGWLGVATTLRDQRRLGAQRALMLARLANATALGCRLATTETGAPEPGQPHPSYSNMLGCGFRQVALRSSWAWPAA